MKNIRIGTDITLYLKLKNTKSIDPINLRSLECIIVNTPDDDQFYAQRYPSNVDVQMHEPSEYCLNNCGYPVYIAYPCNSLPVYTGFGYTPDWAKIYPKREEKRMNYVAEVKATNTDGIVSISFPADKQLYLGKYKLVIIAKMYNPGYKNNIRTITLDYNDVFKLVDNSANADNDTTIIVGEGQYDVETSAVHVVADNDIYVQSGELTYDHSGVDLKLTDGNRVVVDISEETGWYYGD